jgi:hypothetical protein
MRHEYNFVDKHEWNFGDLGKINGLEEKCILKKESLRMKSRLIWLSTGASGGRLMRRL